MLRMSIAAQNAITGVNIASHIAHSQILSISVLRGVVILFASPECPWPWAEIAAGMFCAPEIERGVPDAALARLGLAAFGHLGGVAVLPAIQDHAMRARNFRSFSRSSSRAGSSDRSRAMASRRDW